MTGPTDPPTATVGSVVVCELGVLAMRRAGEWITVTGERTSTLIAALVLAGSGGVSTEELIELVWPSPDQPATARQSLANMVSRLRRTNGTGFIESTRSGYRLGPDAESDRERFVAGVRAAEEALVDAPDRALELVDGALARWRGDPWHGLERPVGVESDRAHLLRVRTNALRARAGALIALDKPEHAIDDLSEVLDADPFDERSRYHLVRTLADTGQRAAALRVLQEANRLFAERGLVLDASLVAEERRLLDEEFVSHAEAAPLPKPATTFVGRSREIEAVTDLLSDQRLVTLHGIGGSGKTRLAIQVAEGVGGSRRTGFTALAGVRTPAQVEHAFAVGLGLPVNRLDGLDADERRSALASAASTGIDLLVIDNCEHVIDDVRDIVGRLLTPRGRLRMLATSRIPLGIAGEHRYVMPRFTDGTELFAERSKQHGVAIEPDRDHHIVAEICDLVDHLPLAIELAAAQIPYRTLREIAHELSGGIAHRDSSAAEPRHATMSTAIRWSHELLDAPAAAALPRLGVFDGWFERTDAASVVDAGDAETALDSLVRHALAERIDHDGLSAYRLPVPVQQYCAAELARTGSTSDVAVTYAEWLLDFTDRPYGDAWWRYSVIDEIDLRLPNALSAVTALRDAGRVDDAVRLASRLGGAALVYGHADELIEILAGLVDGCDDDIATADALLTLALCADAARRGELFSRSLGRLARIGGPAGRRHGVIVHCLNALVCMFAARLTDLDFGPAHDELRRAREHDEANRLSINRAHIEQWQSGIHLFEGDWEAAETAARSSLEVSLGTRVDVSATSSLCHARLQLGDAGTALDLATNHPESGRDTAFGDRLGIVAALAKVQLGDTAAGLAELARMQRRALESPWLQPQDDLVIAIGYAALLLRRDDLARRVVETGVLGYGPWLGYLVPEICRALEIPVTGTYRDGDADVRRRNAHWAAVASEVLDELMG